jgi:hypothetical protein
MKKFIFLLILLFFSLRSIAQKKDSVSFGIDYFDPYTGDKYGFTKKFDHIPTHNDSIAFEKEASITAHKKIDSSKRAMILKLNPPKKHKKKSQAKVSQE